MLKKMSFVILLLSVVFIFGINYTFAADDNQSVLENTVNGMRNVVGGAENTIENAAKGASDTSKNITSDMQNGANNVVDNFNGDDRNSTVGSTMNRDSGNYSATRTSTETDERLLGMNSTTWIWLIMAIVGISIISLIYYYSAAITNEHHYHDNNKE